MNINNNLVPTLSQVSTLAPDVQNTVNRKSIPPYNEPLTEMNLDLESLKVAAPKLIRFQEIGISEKSCLLLQKVGEMSRCSANNCIIDNLIYYIHAQYGLLEKMETTFRMDKFSDLLKEFCKITYFLSYISLSNVLLEHSKQTKDLSGILQWKQYFPPFEQVLCDFLDSEKTIRDCLNSEQLSSEFLKRFNKLGKQSRAVASNNLSEARKKSITYLDNMKLAFICVHEIFSLQKDIMNPLIDGIISEIAEWAPPLKEAPTLENELKSCSEGIIQIFRMAKEQGICGIPFSDNQISKSFEPLIEILTHKNLNENIYYEKQFLYNSQFDFFNKLMSTAYDNFSRAQKVHLPDKHDVEKFKVQVSGETIQQQQFIVSQFMILNLHSTLVTTVYNLAQPTEIEISNRFMVLSDVAFLKLDIICHNFSSLEENKNLFVSGSNFAESSGSSFIEKFSKEISSLSDANAVTAFNEFILKSSSLKKILTGNDRFLINKLTEISCYNNIDYNIYIETKKVFKDFNKEVIECQKLMLACNTALQNAINELSCDTLKLEFLEEGFQTLKSNISQFLSQIFEIPDLLNNLITLKNKNTNKSFYKKSVELNLEDLEDREVPELFNISFELAYQKNRLVLEKASKETLKAPCLIQEAKPGPIPKQNSKTAPITKSIQPHQSAIPAQKACINRKEQLPSNKLKNLLAYLEERGWKSQSINGSHVKFKRENQSLIVPVNKKNLKPGTFHAILDQEEEKTKV